MRHMNFSVVALLVGLVGCTTPLTDAGGRVELVTAPQSQGCKVIQIFPVTGSSPDDALHKALNHTAELGGDSAAIADGHQTTKGDDINAVALLCHAS